jgi:predicted nucleotidyltransferase
MPPTSDSKPGTNDAVARLAARTGGTWPHVDACAREAADRRKQIAAELVTRRLIPADCSFVTHGSLARDEYTAGSDIDWTLLVDGAADPQHLHVVQDIGTMLDELESKPPGPTAIFGGLTFSNDVIHLIGGDADTNKNTTRRMLLLLESRELNTGAGVRERVLRNILRRYLEEDHGYHALHGYKVRVPRFLLNDIVRFWRTMAVDYAAKRRERAGRGWAIRNVKLRLSRKLIFSAGLAMCLACELKPPKSLLGVDPGRPGDFYNALQEFLFGFANRTPLDVLVEFAAGFDADALAAKMLTTYDEFLAILRDPEKRERLERLNVDEAVQDEIFKEARAIGSSFQEGLTKLFFSTNDELTRATQRYGVF